MPQKAHERPSLATEVKATDSKSAGLKSTELKLVQAAMAEFAEHGYTNTDSNKIARRAGFAPQTFYRWFKDKISIFIATYRLWEEDEWQILTMLMQQQAAPSQIAQAVVAQHRAHLLFRRSLRQLALEHPQVRQARAESRLRQVGRIREWSDTLLTDTESLMVMLLQIERLADAVAEGELRDMGLDDEMAMQAMSTMITRMQH